jgi:ElaB/YqjD/DUF883 family membrane-anchored ribosome-binding protein
MTERSIQMVRATVEEITGKDIEKLKADIQKLRDSLGEMLGSVSSYSKEKLTETSSRLRAAINDIQGRAYDRMQERAHMVRDRSQRVVNASRGAVGQRPLTYVATAFLAGVILASIFEWKKSS